MSSTDFDAATSDSKDLAERDVAGQLNKPEHLERLDQYKRKVERKKATIESQLRNAVQTQLDGVQKGLQTLQELEKIVRDVRGSMSEVATLYQDCVELDDVVKPIKELNRKHQQLKTTTVHIHNIFNVPTAVKETQELIEQDRLLEAHRNLAELEHTRDELFIQLYQSEDAFVDKNTSLHHYFEPLNGLSDALGQQLWLVMTQVTGLVSATPSKVVTALRIVEREEKTDALIAYELEARNISGTHLPKRPKKWKDKCFQILETSVSNKFEEMQPSLDEKLENKGWLQDHLMNIAAYSYADLQAMKEHGVACFPPSYDILDFFTKIHHDCLANLISQLVSDDPNARDIIPLLTWIGDVRESFQETLEIDLLKHGPLLDPATEVKLQARCQKQVEDNVLVLVSTMVDTEKEEMCAVQPPEVDINDHYYTTVGITLFQMVDQNMSALSPLGVNNKRKILTICLDAVKHYQRLYNNALEVYHRKHLESQRREPPFYYQYMIASANNCRSCVEFADQLKQKFRTEMDQNSLDAEHEIAFKKISEDFERIAHYCLDCLVDVTFVDLAPVFAELFHKEAWFGKHMDLVGKIEGTLFDYNEDFKYLKQAYHSYVVIECQHKTMYLYMQAMLSKRMIFKKDKDRSAAAQLVKDEARKISTFFLRLSHATNPKYTQVVEEMADLINANQDILALDIAGLANKHPDVRVNHVVPILAMRGDLNRGLVQKVCQQANLKEQLPEEFQHRGSSSTAASSANSATAKVTAAMRKKQEEKILFESLLIPNPYNMVSR